jgi:hypothetical protein
MAMRMRALLTVVGLLCCQLTFPAKKEQKPVVVQQQSPMKIEQPVTINGDVTTHSAPLTEEQKRQEKEKQTDDQALANATVWLNRWTFFLVVVGAVQVVMFYYQLRITREALRDAKEAADASKLAADAAKESADALPKIERAYVFKLAGSKRQRELSPEDLESAALQSKGSIAQTCRRLREAGLPGDVPVNPGASDATTASDCVAG